MAGRGGATLSVLIRPGSEISRMLSACVSGNECAFTQLAQAGNQALTHSQAMTRLALARARTRVDLDAIPRALVQLAAVFANIQTARPVHAVELPCLVRLESF